MDHITSKVKQQQCFTTIFNNDSFKIKNKKQKNLETERTRFICQLVQLDERSGDNGKRWLFSLRHKIELRC